jgi:hypothetical protein
MTMKLSEIERRPQGDANEYDTEVAVDEFFKCSEHSVESLLYFIINYAYIYSNDDQGWIPFELWDTDCEPYDNQVDLIHKVYNDNFIIVLKSRQVGMTWICLVIGLWFMLFHPEQAILLLSKGEEEARELLKRLKGIYSRLPDWMKAEGTPTNNLEEWVLSNGSRAKSVSTKGGDSMTFTIAIVDEADLIHRANTPLSQVMLNIEPTVGLKGKLILLSKSDKSRPKSTFKSIYKAAKAGKNRFVSAFMPWHVNPKRTKEWHKQQEEVSMDIDGTLDTLHESYPATPQEALSPKSGNKRLPYVVVQYAYEEREPLYVYNSTLDDENELDIPEIENLVVYVLPDPDREYFIGVDPAEGLADGDNAAFCVSDDEGKLCARYKGKVDPAILAGHVDKVSGFYQNAEVLYERNNHGILFKKEMQDNYPHVKLLKGWTASGDGTKPGWFTTLASKTYAYDSVANFLRKIQKHNKKLKDNAEPIKVLYDEEVYTQLTSIETSTLKAPQGEEDDLAVAMVLSLVAWLVCSSKRLQFSLVKLS